MGVACVSRGRRIHTCRCIEPSLPWSQVRQEDLSWNEEQPTRYLFEVGQRDGDWPSNTTEVDTYAIFRNPYQRILPERNDQAELEPNVLAHKELVDKTIGSHKAFFTLVYSKPFSESDLNIRQASIFDASFLCLANYYDTFDTASRKVEDFNMTFEYLWKDVSAEPMFCQRLGMCFQSFDIFEDAMKNVIVKDVLSLQPNFPGQFGTDQDEPRILAIVMEG